MRARTQAGTTARLRVATAVCRQELATPSGGATTAAAVARAYHAEPDGERHEREKSSDSQSRVVLLIRSVVAYELNPADGQQHLIRELCGAQAHKLHSRVGCRLLPRLVLALGAAAAVATAATTATARASTSTADTITADTVTAAAALLRRLRDDNLHVNLRLAASVLPLDDFVLGGGAQPRRVQTHEPG